MTGGKGAPKGDKRKRTRAALIEAAAGVIAEKGFDRASLDEICARAGMTRGAFHGNFKSRDELFLAVVDSQLRPVSADFRPGESFRTQMRILGLAVAAEARRRAPMAAGAAALAGLASSFLAAGAAAGAAAAGLASSFLAAGAAAAAGAAFFSSFLASAANAPVVAKAATIRAARSLFISVIL
jgi:AcrR family transcriptional regulator